MPLVFWYFIVGLFYANFRNLVRYYVWNDDDCLLSLSASVDGYSSNSIYSRGKRLHFHEIASRLEQIFGKETLPVVS